MGESVLFSFPSISLAAPHSPSVVGFLVLTSHRQPADFDPSRTDIYLRLQHTPEASGSPSIDVLIEAWRELRKSAPNTFILSCEFGDLTITFPELHHAIPQDDARIDLDLPAEVKREMTWESIVREFESEIDRFVSYRKNDYSLIDAPFSTEKSTEKGGTTASAKAIEAGYASGPVGYASGPSGSSSTDIQPYNPSSYVDEKSTGGRVVLIDEENGAEVGQVGGSQVNTQGIVAGSKDPVEIILPEDGNGPVTVRPADYLRDASHPAYASSTLVQTAATASRLIITTSAYLSNAMISGSKNFTQKTKPAATPLTFQPSTHQRFQQFHNLSAGAAKLSSATIGRVSHLAQNAGAKIAGKDDPNRRGVPSKPGILNKSLIAFSTVADGIDYATKSLLSSGSTAATTMVHHRYGAEAGQVAHTVTGSFKNVGLVYIDATGVSRRAVVKGVAKGMVVGRVRGGGEVIVSDGSGERIDGLPAGWGDGPLGGPHAGPPSGRVTPIQSTTPPPPPGYAPGGYGSVQGEAGGNGAYYPPPPTRSMTEGNSGSLAGKEKQEYRF